MPSQPVQLYQGDDAHTKIKHWCRASDESCSSVCYSSALAVFVQVDSLKRLPQCVELELELMVCMMMCAAHQSVVAGGDGSVGRASD